MVSLLLRLVLSFKITNIVVHCLRSWWWWQYYTLKAKPNTAVVGVGRCADVRLTNQLNSTQRASMDAGVKHHSVHIYLVTTVYQVLQST